MSLPSPGPEWVITGSGSDDARAEHKELLDCAQRVWPRVLSYARRQDAGHVPADETHSLATEIWERVLRSVAKTLHRIQDSRRQVLNLEAYLIGAFQHRFNRALMREKQRHQFVELVAPQQLEELPVAEDEKWVEKLEQDLQIKQVLTHMDDSTRDMWTSRQYGCSWREIGKQHGISGTQAKMRFRYAIEKIRRKLTGRADKGRRPRKKDGGSL